MLKRILYSIHRVLGTILSILFLVWFLSGFVMIYHTFPKIKTKDKYQNMQVLPNSVPSIDSVLNNLPKDKNISSISLRIRYNTPIFEIVTNDSVYKISIDTTISLVDKISYSQIESYAKQWNNRNITKVDTLYELDQWIQFGYLKKDFPIYKFHFSDNKEHQLYVSSKTGEALQFTDKDSRFWAWVGAIPHWVYFTSLRQDSQLWSDVVVWLSGIGSIMCLGGNILGIYVFYKQYKNKKKVRTPYRKFSYKWHHILGFVFGLFVFTFVFSGMMSLADVPDWIVKTHDSTIGGSLYKSQLHIPSEGYPLSYQKILSKYPDKVKSIEWSSFGNIPLYKAIIGDSLYVFDASSDEVVNLLLDKDAIRNRLSKTHKEEINISLMTEYDNYYVGRTDHLALPVYKAEINDADNSTYYINPKNGTIRYYNTNLKARKWAYQGLHSFKFKFLAERPVLWNIVMWTTMIGGTLVSFTGVWLGFRYLKRKIKKLKRYICSNKSKDKNNPCQ
ncbi:PepSY domain-containing protein [Dysgonomonas sp. ZJ709]|uniref:PepSY domain-containing protein n=1 Tax=Dysgonomonas sp. ZJ709 TaxID=2709797 RepID=UPI0013ECDBA5|nr:PepSY domain-containing protein [Dysgonomonas sp. ZJ709]